MSGIYDGYDIKGEITGVQRYTYDNVEITISYYKDGEEITDDISCITLHVLPPS